MNEMKKYIKRIFKVYMCKIKVPSTFGVRIRYMGLFNKTYLI